MLDSTGGKLSNSQVPCVPLPSRRRYLSHLYECKYLLRLLMKEHVRVLTGREWRPAIVSTRLCWQGLKQKLIGCSKSSCHSNPCNRALFLHPSPPLCAHTRALGWSCCPCHPVRFRYLGIADRNNMRPLSLQFRAGVAEPHPTPSLAFDCLSWGFPPTGLVWAWNTTVSVVYRRGLCSEAGMCSDVTSSPLTEIMLYILLLNPRQRGWGIPVGRFLSTLNQGRMLIMQNATVPCSVRKRCCYTHRCI